MPSKEASMPAPRILLTGLVMGEVPRWHDGRLWFSDMGASEVIAVDLAGKSEVVARVPTLGIGFLPDGRLLIVSMRDGLLLRREQDGSLVTRADLTSLSRHPWNDLVVDGRGNAYVDNIGFDFPQGQFTPAGIIALVTPNGTVRQVAEGLAFPNGMAVTPDNQRVWADLPDGHPDGICFDAEGAVWYGDVPAKRCVRVREGGEVLQTIDLDRGCFACALGGAEKSTLFMMAAEWRGSANMADQARTGQVLTTEAPAPGAGWP
jgi:sugar lactone lactonase YvrE